MENLRESRVRAKKQTSRKAAPANRLNIFIDETGEFGFGKGSARFYGVSLAFHEQISDIRHVSHDNYRQEEHQHYSYAGQAD